MDGARSKASLNRRLLLFALGATLGSAITIFAFAEGVDVSVDRQTHYATKADESSRRIEAYHDCRKLIGFEKVYCEDQVARRARDAERQEYQTAADQKQAIWTKAAGVSAGAALFFNLVTIIAIFLTYQEQVEANKRAKAEFQHARHEAAEAAAHRERQLHQTDLTTRAQLRCYLSSEEETCAYDEAGTNVTLGFLYKNVGLTPAHDVMFNMRAQFGPVNGGSSEIRALGQHDFPWGEVGPSATNHVPMTCKISAAEAHAIQARKGMIFCVVTIRYRDEFGDRWQFTQNMLVDSNSKETGTMYSNKCETIRLDGEQEQQDNNELPLEEGREGEES